MSGECVLVQDILVHLLNPSHLHCATFFFYLVWKSSQYFQQGKSVLLTAEAAGSGSFPWHCFFLHISLNNSMEKLHSHIIHSSELSL